MTHKDLVLIGSNWILKCQSWKMRCQYVVSEFRYLGSEEPDIFGLMGADKTMLIEVKVSRSDFLKDKKKEHRIKTPGLGNYKYYLCPNNLIKIEELPEGWGLLSYQDGNIQILKEALYNPTPNTMAQLCLMYSIIRRISKHKHLNKHWIE